MHENVNVIPFLCEKMGTLAHNTKKRHLSVKLKHLLECRVEMKPKILFSLSITKQPGPNKHKDMVGSKGVDKHIAY